MPHRSRPDSSESVPSNEQLVSIVFDKLKSIPANREVMFGEENFRIIQDIILLFTTNVYLVNSKLDFDETITIERFGAMGGKVIFTDREGARRIMQGGLKYREPSITAVFRKEYDGSVLYNDHMLRME